MSDEPEWTTIWGAWRDFIRAVPEMNNSIQEAAFMAGASCALSIAYRRGFVSLRAELDEIQKEPQNGD